MDKNIFGDTKILVFIFGLVVIAIIADHHGLDCNDDLDKHHFGEARL